MANVLFSRTDSPSTKPITDGQIIFDTSGNGKMYLDNGTTRLEMGGAINVDTTLDATSTNPIQNKGVAGVMLSELEEVRGVTKKGFLTDALATKTLDAKIGTTDISSIGDGTVTGAISDVNGKLTQIPILIATSTSGSYTIPASEIDTYKKIQVIAINTSYNANTEITMDTSVLKELGTEKTYTHMMFSSGSGIGFLTQASIQYNKNGDIECLGMCKGWTLKYIKIFGYM